MALARGHELGQLNLQLLVVSAKSGPRNLCQALGKRPADAAHFNRANKLAPSGPHGRIPGIPVANLVWTSTRARATGAIQGTGELVNW
ncbi:hypothetical protein [Roseateles sp. MS654]|uniref:hypothetical protein n=1 Tax=Roseateles sp. MS654 TaxID=3412685 RepID=UPI003C2C1273